MRRDHQLASSRNFFSLTIVTRSLVLFFIFYFTGCAAGSCLSYGHSCWGAHGKRSYNSRVTQQHRSIEGHRDGSLNTEVETDEIAPAPSSKGRWILSRLITGRLMVPAPVLTINERRTSNNRYKKEKFLTLPANWDTDYDSVRNEFHRDEKVENNAKSNEDSKEFDDSFDETQKIKEPRTETTDLLFVPSQRDYKNHPIRSRRPTHPTTSLNNGQFSYYQVATN